MLDGTGKETYCLSPLEKKTNTSFSLGSFCTTNLFEKFDTRNAFLFSASGACSKLLQEQSSIIKCQQVCIFCQLKQ